jgi:hypothetical protein
MSRDLVEDIYGSDMVAKYGIDVVGRYVGTFVGEQPARPGRRAAKAARCCDPETRQVFTRCLDLLAHVETIQVEVGPENGTGGLGGAAAVLSW